MKKLAILILALVFLSSCVEDSNPSNQGLFKPKKIADGLMAEWTIAIYANADNNLSTTFLSDFIEMNSTSNLGKNINVIVIVDYDAQRTIPNSLNKFPTGTAIYKIIGNNLEPIQLMVTSEENFDDPKVLSKHLTYAFQKYPAKKRGIIMWDHGGAWDSGFGGDSQNGTILNAKNLSVLQMRSALADVALSLNLGAKPFDFVDFDTCLMGNLESAYEFKNIAKYYSASAEIDYGKGHDYEKYFSIFTKNSKKNFSELVPEIIKSWDDHHKNAGISDKYLRTKTILATGELDSLTMNLNELVLSLISSLNNNHLTFIDFLKIINWASPGFGSNIEGDSSDPMALRDIGHMVSLMTNTLDPSVNEAADLTVSSLGTTIKAKSLGDIRLGSQIGLSIESTIGPAWTNSKRDKYLTFQWSYDSSWNEVLDLIAAKYNLDAGPPTLVTTIINSTNPDLINKPKISFTTIDADVERALVMAFSVDGSGNLLNLGLVGHSFVENGFLYSFSWDGKQATMTNGVQSSLVAIELLTLPGRSLNGDISGGFFKIRGKLTNGVESFPCDLIGPVPSSELSDLIIYNENGATKSFSLTVLAGLGYSFIPQLVRMPSGGGPSIKIDQTPIHLTAGLTSLEINNNISAPAGDYILGTALIDVWTKSSVEAKPLTIVTPF